MKRGYKSALASSAVIRAVLIALACGIAASTSGAAAPIARNGLIAFSRAQGDNVTYPQIYVIAAKGSQRRKVSQRTAFGGPDWSPDGRRIAYPAEGSIVITRADGRRRDGGFIVPGYADDCCELDWSPHGSTIAFTAGQLYVKTLGGRLRRLTRGGASSPSWSPDGRLIAYENVGRLFVIGSDGRDRRRLASSRTVMDGTSWSPDSRRLVTAIDGRLYVMDVRTRTRRQIGQRRWSKEALWSPSGRWIAFTRARASDKPGDVYLVRPDGSSLRRLSRTPQYEYSLTWSPTGRLLAYAGRRGNVFVVDVTTGRTRQISRTKCGEGADLLEWSPRGDRFAFRSVPVRRDAEIVTAIPDGTDIRQLTDDCGVWEQNPAWSPARDELAYDRYVARTQLQRHIYVANRDGSGVRRITSNAAGGADPSWSPDGEQLVFARRLGDYDTELFVIRRDGSDERRLTDTQGVNFAPTWSPYGERIAFASSRAGSLEIYVMAADGFGARRLTDSGGTQPDWSPDGSRIVFIRTCNIWTMKADGTDQVRLAVRNLYCDSLLSPAWSPDGASIAFSADVDGGRGSQYALLVVDAADGTLRSSIFDNQDNLEPDWQAIP